MSHGAGSGHHEDRGKRCPSFSELYEAHDRLAYARAMEILRDHQLAEDAVQETFIRVARALSEGESPEYPGAWIRTIARNEALRIAGRRQGARELVCEPAVEPPQEKVDDLDEHQKIGKTLDAMPEGEARILIERYIENQSADVLRRRRGLSGSGLFRRLRVARERFRQRFLRPPGRDPS
jgi:RNA polymerase sigma-70 factor (ECF subfamily)